MAGGFDGLRGLCQRAVSDGVVPSLVVAVGQSGRTVFHEAFGHRQIEPARWPATADTVYDLASLTKALVTSLLIMQGVGAGRLELDEPLGPVFGWASGDADGSGAKAAITPRLLLAHAAGFPAHRPFYRTVLGEGRGPDRDRVVALAAAEPLAHPPGARSLYSDIGFILLGALVERRLGRRLDALAAESLFGPLGLADAGFADGAAGGPASGARFGGRPVAATERCPVRGRIVVGEVHDLNAHAMGGVAGHAGLFAGADDVAAVAQALCAAWRGAGPGGGRPPLVARDLLRTFFAPAGIDGSTWRLGWDGPASTGSLAGERIARTAVGHLGFTGCSLWLDPEREAFVVVLTNRIHPTVGDDARFRALRPALNDAALDGAGYRAAPGV